MVEVSIVSGKASKLCRSHYVTWWSFDDEVKSKLNASEHNWQKQREVA